MTTTSAVTAATAATQQAQTSNSAQQISGDFSQFLTLLTTQLKNQDPLSPMDTNQFTQQLVEYSQVEQQLNTNSKLDSLVSQGVNNSLNAALGYVGLDINYESSEFSFDGSTPIQTHYSLASAATTTQMQVVDSQGNIVYQAAGATATGNQTFSWDGSETNGGKAPAGTYTLQINAFDDKGAVVAATSVVPGHVHGVEMQNGTVTLLVGDRAVPIANVLNANQPATTKTTSG